MFKRHAFAAVLALIATVVLIACSGGPLNRSDVHSVTGPSYVPGLTATEPANIHPAADMAAVVTIHETCHELSGIEFYLANGTGRVDSDTVRLVFHSELSGFVYVYVDSVYRETVYLDRDLQNSGMPLTLTFNNTRSPHDYDAYQAGDPGYHYPNTPQGYQYVWSSTGIYGVVAKGANHCQTPKTVVG